MQDVRRWSTLQHSKMCKYRAERKMLSANVDPLECDPRAVNNDLGFSFGSQQVRSFSPRVVKHSFQASLFLQHPGHASCIMRNIR